MGRKTHIVPNNGQLKLCYYCFACPNLWTLYFNSVILIPFLIGTYVKELCFILTTSLANPTYIANYNLLLISDQKAK